MKLINGLWISNIPAFEPLVREFMAKLKCQKCGRCCTLALDGTIVTHDDIRHMAPCMDMSNTAFERQYTHTVDKPRGKMKALNQPCPFHDEAKGCLLYNFRPKVCRIFPVMTVQYMSYGRIGVHVLCPTAHDQLEAYEKSLTV